MPSNSHFLSLLEERERYIEEDDDDDDDDGGEGMDFERNLEGKRWRMDGFCKGVRTLERKS